MRWTCLLLSVFLLTSSALPQDRRVDCRELVLYNGHITTMDSRGSTASAIVIRDDRIALVSNGTGIPAHSACANLIDLKGHRVIPGLVDTHVHLSYATDRPGYA